MLLLPWSSPARGGACPSFAVHAPGGSRLPNMPARTGQAPTRRQEEPAPKAVRACVAGGESSGEQAAAGRGWGRLEPVRARRDGGAAGRGWGQEQGSTTCPASPKRVTPSALIVIGHLRPGSSQLLFVYAFGS